MYHLKIRCVAALLTLCLLMGAAWPVVKARAESADDPVDVYTALAMLDENQRTTFIKTISNVLNNFQLKEQAAVAVANFDAFIEGHGDIRTEVGLNPHALLRPHEQKPTVHMRVKPHALFLDLSQTRQGKDLKPTAVGEHRSIPSHETVKAAEIADQLVTRSDMQVIGIGKDNLAPNSLEIVRG